MYEPKTSTELVVIETALPAHNVATERSSFERISFDRIDDARPVTAGERLRAWLNRSAGNTRRAYMSDLNMFAARIGEAEIGAAIERMCGMSRARALTILEQWRDDMRAANLSSSTVNRRLAAVNSALREIAKADIGPGRLDLMGVKTERRKDARGPSVSKVVLALDRMQLRARPIDVRDAAIIRLCAQRGLRRSEVVNLTVADYLIEAGELRVLRKGHSEKVTIQIAGSTAVALKAWLAIRSEWAAPECTAMFVPIEKGKPSIAGICGDAIYGIARRHCGSRPHGLRHTAITSALKATGNLEAACEFAGHASVSTTQVYLDDRREVEREAVSALGEMF